MVAKKVEKHLAQYPEEERDARVAAFLRAKIVSVERIKCPRCEGQKYDKGSCQLCGSTGFIVVESAE